MKQKKLIFNFSVNRNWKKLTDSRKGAKILADNRNSHHPIGTHSYMGNLSGESRERDRKDKATRFPSVTYAREL